MPRILAKTIRRRYDASGRRFLRMLMNNEVVAAAGQHDNNIRRQGKRVIFRVVRD